MNPALLLNPKAFKKSEQPRARFLSPSSSAVMAFQGSIPTASSFNSQHIGGYETNPVFEHPNMLDEDYIISDGEAQDLHNHDDADSLTHPDAKEDKKAGRKDSQRGSGASTPRDGVAGFLHEGGARAVTPLGENMNCLTSCIIC